jgi:hypothetical protein
MDSAKRVVLAVILLNAVIAFAYLTGSAVYGPPPDYRSPTRPPRGTAYTDPVFNAARAPGEWIRRISDAATTPAFDTSPDTLSWISHEYSTATAFNSDKTRALLIHQSYFALYDLAGNLIRRLPQICPLCAPRWSRTDPAVFYYVSNKQVFRYNATANSHTPVGPALPYDLTISRGEDDICFDGDHLVGFGQRAGTYYLYVFSITAQAVISEYSIGGAAEFANVQSAEIAPNDIVIVSYNANDRQNTKAPKTGMWAFTLGLTPLQQVYTALGHHDLGSDVDGSPILVITNAGSFHPLPGCPNGIEKIRILNPDTRTCLLPMHWTLAIHISMPDQAGWALVSTYAPGDAMHGSLSGKEEGFPLINFSGATWNLQSNSRHSGGTARWSANDQARMSYFFYGTQVHWIARKDARSGIADVTIDGETTPVDLYSAQPAFRSVVYSRTNLPAGFHTFTIDVTRRKNSQSAGYRVWVDSIRDDTPWTPYTNEIMMVRLDGSQTRRLIHHRSRPFNDYNYTPRATVSRDGTRVLFSSNYGMPVGYTNYSDVYVMAVDLGSSDATATAAGAGIRPNVPDVQWSPAQRMRINEYLYPRRRPGR